MFMRIKFDKRKATVSLHTNFREIADGLEEWDEVRLGTIRDEVADVDGGVIRRSLLDDGFVRQRSTLEVDGGGSTTGSAGTRGRYSASCSTLCLLVGPVDTDGTRTKPFTVHCRNGLLSIGLVPESEETIATGFARVHVPHDAGVGHGAKGTEGFGEDIIVDLGAEITNEDVVVTGRVLLILLALIGPVDTDLSIEDLTAIERLERGFGCTHVDVLDEAIVEATVLIIAVRNNFNVLDRTSNSEDFGEHVLGNTRAQVSDIEMGTPLHLHFIHLRGISGTPHGTHLIHDSKKYE
jgi:hypothetical protein